MIDEVAREIALRRWALPESLHIPVAAVDENAISNYIGAILQRLDGRGAAAKALLVQRYRTPPVDERLPIWDIEGSKVFHQEIQVWVDVSYTRYRQAYRKAFPQEPIDGKVLSHALNRRVAALKGFRYVRITPTSRRANSSSAFSEGWSVSLHSSPEQMDANRKSGAFIQYADLSDLLLMLDMKLGGGVMALVNEGQRLVSPRPR